MTVRLPAAILAGLSLLLLRADDPALAPPPGPPATNAPAVNAPPAAVQVDVARLLNARVVATLTGGKVIPPAMDIDGTGGIATAGAAASLDGDPSHAVPDDGAFVANADHPAVVLHFSNADGTSPQVRRMPKPDDFSFSVPPRIYAKMLLVFTSAAGPARLHITLTYQDGTKDERDEVCPDWAKGLDSTYPDCTRLASNLASWSPRNKVSDKDHPSLYSLDAHPTAGKVLTLVTIHKTRPLVCFWGATGVPAP